MSDFLQGVRELMASNLDALSVVVGALTSMLLSYVFFRILWALKKRDAGKLALSRGRATIRGQVAEQLAPLMPEFPYANADARFLGAPVDYIVFDGLSDDEEVDIVIVEIKTGRAKLSPREKRIKEACKAGRIRFEVVRIS